MTSDETGHGTCQWCTQIRRRTPVVRGRDGPFLVCTSCRELGLRLGYHDTTAATRQPDKAAP